MMNNLSEIIFFGAGGAGREDFSSGST